MMDLTIVLNSKNRVRIHQLANRKLEDDKGIASSRCFACSMTLKLLVICVKIQHHRIERFLTFFSVYHECWILVPSTISMEN